MATLATLKPEAISVQPGGEAECELTIRNTGRIVDQFSFEALGRAAPWTSFEPSTVKLFPDTEGTTRLLFRPPRAPTTPAGPCAVGVRVRSKEDPRAPVVEELTLDIGRVADTFAELIPRTGRGARQASYHLAVDNRGNSTLNAKLGATDPDDRLRFTFEPPTLTAEPGTAAFAKVVAHPLKRFLRGQPVSHPFLVRVQPEGEAPLTVEGTMLQEALIPKWVPRALLALALAAVLWAVLLKPTVKSTAKEAANDALAEPLRQASTQIAALAAKVGASPPAPLVPGPPTPASTSSEAPAPGAPTSPVNTAAGGSTDGRVELTPQKQTNAYPVPEGKTLSVTDIFLQNPQGDSGLLRVRRGDITLLAVRLENFRDLDYHFISPWVFTTAQPLTLSVECQLPSPGNCTPAATFSGFLGPAT